MYTIYELIKPDFLQKTEPDGYYTKTLERNVLQKLDETGVYETQETHADCMAEIVKNKEKLKYKSLTILEVININYEGKIS
jgi:hypothetical protein